MAYQHLRPIARKRYPDISQPGRRKPRRIRLAEEAERLFGPSLPVGAARAGSTFAVGSLETESTRSLENDVPGMREGDVLLRVDGDSTNGGGLTPETLIAVWPEVGPRAGGICAVWVAGAGATP